MITAVSAGIGILICAAYLAIYMVAAVSRYFQRKDEAAYRRGWAGWGDMTDLRSE
jgi:hypothetical protein